MLLVDLTDIFPLFVYVLESSRLTPLIVQLNQAVFYLFSPSDHRGRKPAKGD
jgi:hypothetical protein